MLDFVSICTRPIKGGVIEIYPEFLVGKSKDLMVRGKSFYAVWDDELGLWSRSESDIKRMIDDMLRKKKAELPSDTPTKIQLLENFSSRKWTEWQTYVKSLPDNYKELDKKVIFSNTNVRKTDYASKKLDYPMEEGPIVAYEELINALYSEDERQKIEWAIGAIISGDSKKLQKFIVLYGSAGTGKSTVLNIIQDIFKGYYTVFDAKNLGSSNNAFALEAFKDNPLVAIQHDGDLSRIEDNTKLNSIVSHEQMIVNEKFKATYSSRFDTFLFMGTNKPVKITDAKSGIIRRLIDVSPTGNKIPMKKYQALMSQIGFELGAIAAHCLKVYNELGFEYYDSYKPIKMLGATNDFFNFVEDSYDIFLKEEFVTLKSAWARYKEYCSEANVAYPYSMRVFKEELKNYFANFEERFRTEDGYSRNVYSGFLKDKFTIKGKEKKEEKPYALTFNETKSIFDKECADCIAQYASDAETPLKKWANVSTKLSDLDTKKLHYVQLPENHIVIDFDIKDDEGNKSFEKNLEAASKWPLTYAELSKSGAGIHLHYIYTGDVSKLSRVYDDNIEVKVFTGDASLRRKLTKCNNVDISKLSSGLPLKGGNKKMLNFEGLKNEKAIRTMIKQNLNKEIHPGTKPSVDFIFKILNDAYEQGVKYDVTDLRPAILAFANNSTNHSAYCVKLVNQMKFKSEEPNPPVDFKKDVIVFYDVEVFPNLFVVNWKYQGKDKKVVRMINPAPKDIEDLLQFKLIGFNNRRYDNHMLYARLMGYSNEDLYKLSQRIINGSRNAFFGEAYNLSYADIYDFSSKKQSLKKWEIELDIHHQELGLPWDQPVPEDKWELVAEYCDNDVIATEATFEACKQDFIAREILAEISGLTINDTTQMHTAKIIFGDDKHPQDKFVYTDLSEMFPGYKFDNGISTYMDEEVGEGGYVYSEPGMYGNVALLDIASMHPNSLINLNLFGPYTKNFKQLLDTRILIKHKDYDKAKKMLNGVLEKYLDNPENSSALSYALKIVINSVYGLTSATFDNKFKDPRNIDNIVAKRGALFMINLKHEVQKLGYKVAHIKTDSIKIPNADDKIIKFVFDYGKKYGYDFEHEATYDKMCLVNDAVYIARYKTDDGGLGDWTATGTQFAVPYVFKTLFSHEKIIFKDMCETKSVKTKLYLDMNEDLPEGEHLYQFVGSTGAFCPIKPGCGGGILLRESGENKYAAAVGTKGYRWLESEVVKQLGKEKDIDKRYYAALVDAAVAEISKYGSFEWFVSDDIYTGLILDDLPTF